MGVRQRSCSRAGTGKCGLQGTPDTTARHISPVTRRLPATILLTLWRASPAAVAAPDAVPWGPGTRWGPLPIPAEDWATPQPATRGMDAQECGYTALPVKVQLSALKRGDLRDYFSKTGVWRSLDGGTFATWTQNLFRLHYRNVDFFVDTKFFFRIEAISNENIVKELIGVALPEREGVDHATFLIQDCHAVVMYVLREDRHDPDRYEIYNHIGQFIAGSRRVQGENIKDQIHFYDEKGMPIAVAQSPMVWSDIATAPDRLPGQEPGDIAQWQVWFAEDYPARSSLVFPDYRWVIAAAVQERAIRDSTRYHDGTLTLPLVFPLYVVWCVLIGAAALVVCATVPRMMFFLVYPAAPMPTGNPFLKSPGQYGTTLPDRLR